MNTFICKFCCLIEVLILIMDDSSTLEKVLAFNLDFYNPPNVLNLCSLVSMFMKTSVY